MSNTATRLITLILLLQRQPNLKAADLAGKLGVSVRTLHRYIGMLDEMGIPVYSERGPYGGFSLVRGYKLPPLVFSPEEAVAVYLGASLVEAMWGRLYLEAAQGALAKLDNVLPDEQRQEIAWARRSLATAGMHRADLERLAPYLEKLRRALREHRGVLMHYRSSGSTEMQPRQVDPYALVHRWGWWYTIGYCHLRQGLRSFRIDRILELSLTSEAFDIPASFNLQEYLAGEFQSLPKFQARLRFFPQGAHAALDNPSFWETVEKQPDGAIVVTFSSPDVEWAASIAMAYGPIVEVLEPPELRQMVKDWAQAVVSRYNQDVVRLVDARRDETS